MIEGMRNNSLGNLLAGGYVSVCVAATAWLVFRASGQELAGVVILILGLPWSLLVTMLAVMMGLSSAWVYGIGFFASCGINAWLLKWVGDRIANRRS